MVFWRFMNSNSGALTAIATIVLAFITFVYVYLIHKQLKEEKDFRRELFKPYLTAELSTNELKQRLYLWVTNHGQTEAKNIKVSFTDYFEPSTIPSIGPRQEKAIPKKGVSETVDLMKKKEEKIITCEISYENESGEKYYYSTEIDVNVAINRGGNLERNFKITVISALTSIQNSLGPNGGIKIYNK